MKTILNVNVKSDKDFCVLTHHPKWEAILAKQFCDKIEKDDVIYNINTVSTDATAVYWYYGKFVKSIDVHLFLDGNESTIEDIFKSYNLAFDYSDNILTDEALKKIDEYYDNLERSKKEE